ncbi:hypothetical protein MRX96_044756 [Rhipicephalus microplus]
MTSTDQPDVVKNANASKSPTEIKPFNPDQFRFGARLKIIPMNDQIKELQTIIRDRNTTRSEFVFYADRLIRIVVEEGLNQLSYSECAVTTPTGSIYQGIKFLRGELRCKHRAKWRSHGARPQGLLSFYPHWKDPYTE